MDNKELKEEIIIIIFCIVVVYCVGKLEQQSLDAQGTALEQVCHYDQKPGKN